MTAPSARARIRRVPSRADYQRETIDAILDEALVAHLGFAVEGQPYVIPTLHARVGDVVYIHGSSASRAIRALSGGLQACLTVTLLDGLVLARSAFHHSMNYRSVVVLGEARPGRRAGGAPEGARGVHRAAGPRPLGRGAPADRARSSRARACSRSTSHEASAKVRTGPPVDDDEDYALDVWAGVIPLTLQAGPLIADPKLTARHRALGGGAALAGLSAWLLGSGGWIPTGRRATTCVLVRRGDARAGARRRHGPAPAGHASPSGSAGVTRIDLALTHFHLDHVCGLTYLPGLPVLPTIHAPGAWLYGKPSAELLAPLLDAPISPSEIRGADPRAARRGADASVPSPSPRAPSRATGTRPPACASRTRSR